MVIGSEPRHCSRTAVSMRSRLRSVALSKNIDPQYTNPARKQCIPQSQSSNPTTARLQFIDFRRQNEIALGQTVDLMRPNRDLRFAPAKANIRMMSLLLGQRANAVDELK